MPVRITSLNLAAAQPLVLKGRSVRSGIFKTPVDGPVCLRTEGLEGDEQADRRYHGGPDKAINVYPGEHYAHWSELLERVLTAGAFGENFTTTGLDETSVAIGDVFRVGKKVLVQVTQPRQPCSKLAARHDFPALVRLVKQSCRTGFYLRCLQPGEVRSGDGLVLVERPSVVVTVREAYETMRWRKRRPAAVERLLAVAALSSDWRKTLEAAG